MPEKVADWKAPKVKFPVNTSFRFLQLRAMKEFGKTPDEWEQMPKESRAECIGFSIVDNKIQSYQMQQESKKK